MAFSVLKQLVFKLRPHLGGDTQDLQQLVLEFNIINNESLEQYQHRHQEIHNTISIQKDQTGQDTRLLHFYVSLLSTVPEYLPHLILHERPSIYSKKSQSPYQKTTLHII